MGNEHIRCIEICIRLNHGNAFNRATNTLDVLKSSKEALVCRDSAMGNEHIRCIEIFLPIISKIEN